MVRKAVTWRGPARAGALASVSNLSSAGNSVSTTPASPCGEPRQHVGQAMIGLRADHEIDGRRPAEHFLAFGLRDAASHRDRHAAARLGARFFQAAQAAKFGIDLLGGLFADMAGIEDDEIGLGGLIRRRIALRRQDFGDALAVIDVHLTAIGLDEQFFARRTSSFLALV